MAAQLDSLAPGSAASPTSRFPAASEISFPILLQQHFMQSRGWYQFPAPKIIYRHLLPLAIDTLATPLAETVQDGW